MDGKPFSQASKNTQLIFKEPQTFKQSIKHSDENLSLFGGGVWGVWGFFWGVGESMREEKVGGVFWVLGSGWGC